MLQRLAQFRVALLEFLEQPNILDRDDGLVGKGFEQSDLFVREWTNFLRRIKIAPIEIPSRNNGVASSGANTLQRSWNLSLWKLGFSSSARS